MVSIGSFRDEGGAMAVRNIPLGVVVEIRFFVPALLLFMLNKPHIFIHTLICFLVIFSAQFGSQNQLDMTNPYEEELKWRLQDFDSGKFYCQVSTWVSFYVKF